MPLFAVPDWLDTWITPLWMIGLGCLAGLLILLVLWGVLFVVRRLLAQDIVELLSSGVLLQLTWVVVGFALIGIIGSFIVRERNGILASVLRVPFTGIRTVTIRVPAATETEETAEAMAAVQFRGDELRTIQVDSRNDVRVVSPQMLDTIPAIEIEVTGGEAEHVWDRVVERGDLLDGMQFDALRVENLGDTPVDVAIQYRTAPQHPQATSLYYVALGVVGTYLLYVALYALFPKMAAVAMATSKSQMAQPLYWILLLLGMALLVLFVYIPYYTFGEDIKVLKDSGITLVLVFAIVQAVWAASTSVEDEIEGKTALTILSKPIGRRPFLLGKFVGISWATVAFIAVLGACLLVLVAYKPIYDARETAEAEPVWQQAHAEVMRTIPGLVLALMETLVFISISVAISTRLPLLANLTICFVIYAFGHLTAQLVQSGEGQLENVKFMAQFIATVLPVLDHYNIQAAIARGVDVPMSYLLTVGAYCALYCIMALLLALVLFEDRDLA